MLLRYGDDSDMWMIWLGVRWNCSERLDREISSWKCVFRYARIRLDGEDGCSGDRERPGSAANWSSKASSSLSRATGSVADCCMICKRDRMVGLDRMEYSRQSCELSGTEAPVKNSMVIRRVEFSGRIAWHSPGGNSRISPA